MAVSAGADAIGLVFYPPSPRAVSIEEAKTICAAVPAFVSVVALSVDADDILLGRIVSELAVDILQFHGSESLQRCEQFQRPYIKALRMKEGLDLEAEVQKYPSARSVLLDAYRKGVPGGTGECFDWQKIPAPLAGRIILAGGLNPDNVSQAIEQVQPFAVDVSGGVEGLAGVKDTDKIQQFMARVRAADSLE